MNLYEEIVQKKQKISVVGLGYVGMPIAVSFSKKIDVIGFDVNKQKIDTYKQGIDPTKEVGDKEIKKCNVLFTYDETDLDRALFHIVAVPTPINDDKTPNLKPVISASETVGRHLKRGAIVVFESTVYPGVTEDICVPILEQQSELKCGVDFKVGYSPERINPGDKVHRLETIVKIVSGMDEQSLDTIAKVYELVVDAGVFRASCIKVAEAAKVIENSQRDINIAFMNELSIIFNNMGIDTREVLEAAGTKWNFLKFTPGLVGGHCIGVDPYYLTYRAKQLGYDSKIILSGRTINDGMGKYIAVQTIKKMIKKGINIKGSKVAIFGITFKENCPDIRNTKVVDLINELEEYGVNAVVVDPVSDKHEMKKEYNIDACSFDDVKDIDACIFAVGHKEFLQIDMNKLKTTFANNGYVLIDVKSIFEKDKMQSLGFDYWRL